MENRFKIVIPSYNNQEWVEYNLASILNQTYTNYEVLYIDDASTDNTLDKVKEIVGNLPNWKVVSNPVNMKRGFNISPQNPHIVSLMKHDSDILVFVDGDDWLADNYVLENLNRFYNRESPWMTYGRYVDYPEYTYPSTQNTAYPEHVHANKLYRKDVWRASHLRTFKWFLYRQIKPESQRIHQVGNYYYHAEDLATTFPCLEMCPPEKIGVLDFVAYVFNNTKGNSARSQERTHKAENEGLEWEIRSATPYPTLNENQLHYTLPQ